MAKILGISGSPKKGATEYAVRAALEAASEIPGIETEFMTLRGKKIAPCNACNYCREHQTMCIIKDDMQELFEQFVAADAFIIGSPVYVHTITPQLMSFFSRMRPIHHVFPGAVRNKLGAALAVGGTRNGGEEFAVNTIIHLMMTRGLNIVSNEVGGYIGGKIWSQDKKDFNAEDDIIGMKTVTDLGKKLAEATMIFEAGKKALGK